MSVTTILVVVEPESMPMKTSCSPFLNEAVGNRWVSIRFNQSAYVFVSAKIGGRSNLVVEVAAGEEDK